MNHNIAGRTFGRTSDHRKAMFKNMAISLIEHETIKTTLPKAKELRRFVEPLITLASKNTLHARRLLISRLGNKNAIEKLLKELGPFYSKRPGGYTRVLRNNFRAGDNAPMAIIQLVDLENLVKARIKPKTKKVSKSEPKPEKALAAPKAAAKAPKEVKAAPKKAVKSKKSTEDSATSKKASKKSSKKSENKSD